ncbi:MAG TPA: TIM-barrel domain-containing protein, partial [Verrucomicrobiae bacterium]|nr:TIM-barrel domain-containing protein [Verrucomicrobiae bacterium]
LIETAEARVSVEPETLCVEITDTARGFGLARICGEGLHRVDKTLAIEPRAMRNVYGVGNYFHNPPSTDGDWSGKEWHASGYGAVRRPAHGAAPSESQFPVVYALGEGNRSFALFFDNVYRIDWDFRDERRWTASTWGDQLRFYVMTGEDLKDLRMDFIELTGFPRIPPRSTFGLWVSKFGYLNWDDLRLDLDSLRKNSFPVDGFALDLQWFGGTFNDATNPRMGRLWFDPRNFASPEAAVKRLREKLGIRLMLVEESYVDERLEEYRLLQPPAAPGCFLARAERDGCVPARLGTPQDPLWWGRGGMLDWTDPAGGKYWHDLRRLRLSLLGITSHWLDLGEPEMFVESAWYHGAEPGKERHIDVHNLYNFLWADSIHRGYRDRDNQRRLMKELSLAAAPRYFSMSRAGAPGMQRLSAGMWSGDIGRNMGSLRAHLNTQMHMSLAGIDYYNSDVGGYIGTHGFDIEPEHTDAELYTQWFADSALGEIPLRPHGWAYSGEIPTFGPDRQGHRESNRANLLQRYELFPYVYSLAHRAWRFGEPIFPPLVYHFQTDPKVRTMGNQKMIGADLVYGVVVGFGSTERRMYLPAGEWVNYNTHQWFSSRGEETPELPLYMPRYVRDLPQHGATPQQKTAYLERGPEGLALTLPLFARAGAIIPVMYTDAETLNISGARADGRGGSELRVKVFASPRASSFTIYEDDGETVAYESGAVRETPVRQQAGSSSASVIFSPSSGSFAGAPGRRSFVVHLVVRDALGTAVELNGTPLPHCGSTEEFEKMERACWVN